MSLHTNPHKIGSSASRHSPESTQLQAILFDFGGVICGSPFSAFAEYEQRFGLGSDFIRNLNSTNPDNNAWARLERNELSFEEFCAAFEAEAAQAGGELDARELFAMISGDLRPQMVQAVRICGEHYKTGLLTNNFVTPLTTVPRSNSEMAQVLALFDLVVESSVVGIRKPDPRFYELACDQLAIKPEHAVFLDDLGVNLKPARAMGMHTIKVTDATQALAELSEVTGLSFS